MVSFVTLSVDDTLYVMRSAKTEPIILFVRVSGACHTETKWYKIGMQYIKFLTTSDVLIFSNSIWLIADVRFLVAQILYCSGINIIRHLQTYK